MSLFQYGTEPGGFFGQINPFLPTRRLPTVDHSLCAGGAQRQCLQACRRMAISRKARSLLALPDFSEFARAVRYGVPGTPLVVLAYLRHRTTSGVEFSQILSSVGRPRVWTTLPVGPGDVPHPPSREEVRRMAHAVVRRLPW